MRTRCTKCKVGFPFEGSCPYCGRALKSEGDLISSRQAVIVTFAVLLVVAGLAYFLLNSSFVEIDWRKGIFHKEYKTQIAPPREKVVGKLKPALSLGDYDGDYDRVRSLLKGKQFQKDIWGQVSWLSGKPDRVTVQCVPGQDPRTF